MNTSRRQSLCGLLALISLAVGGCEPKGPQRYHHWGKVTYLGRPVPAGIMYFDPDIGAGNDGPQGHATIANGEYDTRKAGGQGPGSGKYVVRVYAHDGVAVPELPMGKLLFPETVVPVELPANEGEQDLKVTPQRP
jgi:hypothetical protein